MTDWKASSAADFIGFLDGYQARNMASIERGTALQVSELHARLRLLRGAVEALGTEGPLVAQILEAEEKLRDPAGTIVTRLSEIVGKFHVMLAQHMEVLTTPTLRDQVRLIVRRLLEAAELSHSDGLVQSTVQLAELFTSSLPG